MGVDLGTRAGTAVYAMTNCEVFGVAFRGGKGDYGGTLILKADFSASPFPLFMLYGHLSRASLLILKENQRVKAGDLIGWVGESHENGGWNPHVHIQFSWLEPAQVDLPGAVAVSDSELASLIFPDPTRAIQNAQAGWPLTSAFS
jgi:murein DD-endopeptidase MepM/ murein hydrolase activator NlpD